MGDSREELRKIADIDDPFLRAVAIDALILERNTLKNTVADLQAKLEAESRTNEMLEIGKRNTEILLEECQNQAQKAEQERDNLQILLDSVEKSMIEQQESLNHYIDKAHEYLEERNNLQAANAVLVDTLFKNRCDFCDKFENRKNHSTICYPPWGDICEELDNCKKLEDVLEKYRGEVKEV